MTKQDIKNIIDNPETLKVITELVEKYPSMEQVLVNEFGSADYKDILELLICEYASANDDSTDFYNNPLYYGNSTVHVPHPENHIGSLSDECKKKHIMYLKVEHKMLKIMIDDFCIMYLEKDGSLNWSNDKPNVKKYLEKWTENGNKINHDRVTFRGNSDSKRYSIDSGCHLVSMDSMNHKHLIYDFFTRDKFECHDENIITFENTAII